MFDQHYTQSDFWKVLLTGIVKSWDVVIVAIISSLQIVWDKIADLISFDGVQYLAALAGTIYVVCQIYWGYVKHTNRNELEDVKVLRKKYNNARFTIFILASVSILLTVLLFAL